MSWNRLEHQLWNQIKRYDLQDKTFILAVSGGLDSMVMLAAFQRLNLKYPLIVAHFHHGESDDQVIKKFRDEALLNAQGASEKHLFVSAHAQTKLRTEAEFRKARRQFIESILETHPNAIVVTAHHQNDHLETLMLKMMRGSGVAGLKNFKEFNGKIFRPFLLNQKEELRVYARERKVQWIDDPSNQDTKPLRNWLRLDLLPQLEFRHTGALRNLFNTMDRLLNETDPDQFFLSTHQQNMKLYQDEKLGNSCVIEIDRSWYKEQSQTSKEKVLYLALKQAQNHKYQSTRVISVSKQEKTSAFWDITKGRVKEIIKRLDKNQKDIKFNMGPLKALTSSKKIMLQFKL